MVIAESSAPSPPRAADLVDRLRPWWECRPGRFKTLAQRLSRLRFAYCCALDGPRLRPAGDPVPTLISHVNDVETFSRIIYFSMRNDRLRLRFLLDEPPRRGDNFEVTFVSLHDAQPLLLAVASRRLDGEYRLETDLTSRIVASWRNLWIGARMPFGLILRPAMVDG
jgi:hypothetical protein